MLPAKLQHLIIRWIMILILLKSIILFFCIVWIREIIVMSMMKNKITNQNKRVLLFVKLYTFFIMLITGFLMSINPFVGIILLIFVPIGAEIIKKNAIRKKQRMIQFYGYKIFKFIINQISSGILVSDALQSMFLIVKDLKLRRCLIEVSAYYAHTTDIQNALDILKQSYSGIEVETLCVAIEQAIQTGSNFETLVKMEELLFKKYIFQIKHDTELRKKRGILAVLLLCIVVILLIAVPIILDIVSAFNQIFF